MKRKLCQVGGCLCLALTVYFLIPVTMGAFHLGMIWPSLLLLFFAALLFRPQWFDRIRRHRLFCRLFCAALCIGLSAVTAVFILMGLRAADRPSPRGDITVIILGCQVNGTTPSIILQSRIDAAYDYLIENPDAVCIASGGMDDDEIITEASCIRSVLLERGIGADRIFVEDASGSTAENLAFSAAIIQKEGLSSHVAIASDNFHQLRASIYAQKNGLQAQSLGCPSVWYLGPGYWAREVVAIAAAVIRGY